MIKFIGKWTDGESSTEIIGDWEVITVKYSDGRGPFEGYIVNSTLTVDFTDDAVFAGLLNVNTITWTNGTVWTRVED